MLRPPTENQFDRREPIISARHAVERLSLHRRHDGTAEMCELDAFVHVQVDSLSKDSFADLDAATPFSLKKRAMLAPQQMVFEAMEQKSTSFADELKNAVHELCGTEKKIFNIPIPNLKSHVLALGVVAFLLFCTIIAVAMISSTESPDRLAAPSRGTSYDKKRN
ncbi:unnamed protein product [Malassezia sympodialis ATCC 42132]|uniref:uncharacterized protein n=1 Tax=Malassezia sympodialis (strain ATCC 42132) TaxID=1230383 RepID=UPI0002C23B9D|nr:uncharacterized protein MSY001_1065 [Malassezia sympodialis ATCC 42132]CCU98359.1 unnamed protein product [Malassezia sympodialis ATCC 42132]|eukprot:XP_018739669.1 uncharacterized protein MSY001_1065 [Malassezia sympodialis ATCC 42132]